MSSAYTSHDLWYFLAVCFFFFKFVFYRWTTALTESITACFSFWFSFAVRFGEEKKPAQIVRNNILTPQLKERDKFHAYNQFRTRKNPKKYKFWKRFLDSLQFHKISVAFGMTHRWKMWWTHDAVVFSLTLEPLVLHKSNVYY